MKKILAAAALTLLCAFPAQAAELFGIEFGSPASKYDISKEVLAEQGKMKMYKVVPPQPDAGIPGYALTAYDGKVVRITAFSRADYSDEGTETRKLFASTVDKLTKRFGGPAVFDEDLATDSKLTAENQCGNGREESSGVHKEPPSPTPLLGYMDEQVPVQGTELWRASALGVGGYG